MAINDLIRDITAARDIVAALANLAAGAEARARLIEVQGRLGAALAEISEFRDSMFALQEQNQQLRKDLTQRVCPRLCAHGRGCAS